jgi:hypothetical protein
MILIDAEKGFDKIQHSFMIKALKKLERGKVPQHNKSYIQQTYCQHHTEWEKLKSFPLKSRMRQGCHSLHFYLI